MIEIAVIEVKEKLWLNQDFAGYCEAVGRYLFAKHRSYFVSYYDFYFIENDLYQRIQAHAEDYIKGTCPYPEELQAILLSCPAGADYCRDYQLGCREARRLNPIPRSDGPFLYDGQFFYYHLALKGRHYAVPPVDIGRLRHDGKERQATDLPSGVESFSFDDEDFRISFRGKDVTEELKKKTHS